MKPQNTDAGIQFIGKLYRDFQIEAEWSQISERGFCWWASNYPQRIWADKPMEDQGIPITKVTAETGFLNYNKRSSEIEHYFAIATRFVNLNGPIINIDSGSIKFRCSSFFHKENQDWLGALFTIAVITQYAEIFNRAEKLAPLMLLEADIKPHPTSGYRTQPHKILRMPNYLEIPKDEEPFDKIPDGFFQKIAEDLKDQGLLTPINITPLSPTLFSPRMR
jgi:hypothetical protein